MRACRAFAVFLALLPACACIRLPRKPAPTPPAPPETQVQLIGGARRPSGVDAASAPKKKSPTGGRKSALPPTAPLGADKLTDGSTPDSSREIAETPPSTAAQSLGPLLADARIRPANSAPLLKMEGPAPTPGTGAATQTFGPSQTAKKRDASRSSPSPRAGPDAAPPATAPASPPAMSEILPNQDPGAAPLSDLGGDIDKLASDRLDIIRYRIQISTEPQFSTLLFNRVFVYPPEVNARDVFADQEPNPPDGNYWVRLAMIDLLGVQQPFLKARRYNLTRH